MAVDGNVDRAFLPQDLPVLFSMRRDLPAGYFRQMSKQS
jgi:hypothetical protein